MKSKTALAALLLAVLIAALRPLAGEAAPTFPALTGRVVDDAHVLSGDVRADLDGKLADLERRTSRQLVVVTLPSLQGEDIADYGYQLGRAWGVGQKSLNNGSLFIVAPSEHKVRIEAGYGVEPILTDAVSSQILYEKVLPAFRAGDIPKGVEAGTQAIVDQLSLDPSTAERKAAQAESARSDLAREGPAAHRPVSILGLVIPLIFFLIVVSRVFGGRGGGLLPGLVIGGMLGGLRGGDDEDGGGGGGGFSGGGGSFGGGGASGSW